MPPQQEFLRAEPLIDDADQAVLAMKSSSNWVTGGVSDAGAGTEKKPEKDEVAGEGTQVAEKEDSTTESACLVQ
ncbi:hypothetical protein VTK26DRAFT_7176 [Humicola hyalothermophila]